MSNAQATDILNLTTGAFQKVAIEDPTPILIDFWAPWCGPCRMMNPILHQAAEKLGAEVRIAKVNVDDEPALAEAFGVRGIPTFALMKGGKVVDAFSGVMPADALVARIRRSLGK
ncbi:MAG TPA: thioredoxin [Fimbriimonadaceae bacterium]|nr:thioredoxin [Fimbriimonadaceae bacterium]